MRGDVVIHPGAPARRRPGPGMNLQQEKSGFWSVTWWTGTGECEVIRLCPSRETARREALEAIERATKRRAEG